MKKLFIIVLASVCYLGIQYYIRPVQLLGPAVAYADQETLDIPEACNSPAREFQRICYGTNSGNVPYTKQVIALKKIKSCLKKQGFSDDRIKETLILIKKNAADEFRGGLSKK